MKNKIYKWYFQVLTFLYNKISKEHKRIDNILNPKDLGFDSLFGNIDMIKQDN
jgi:hypothetical protein